MKKSLIYIVFLVTALLSSCVITIVDDKAVERSWTLKSEFRRTLPLRSGGEVYLRNVNGDIQIQGWDEEKIEIVAEERSLYPPPPGVYFSGRRRPEPEIRLQAAEESVQIETGYDEKEAEVRRVLYFLRLPRSVNLRDIRNGEGTIRISDVFGKIAIKQEKGDVKVSNFSGSLDVELNSGNVEAELLDLRPEDDVRVTNREGDIVLYLEAGADFELKGEAPNGHIDNDFDIKGEGTAKRALLALIALDGDIEIKKIQE